MLIAITPSQQALIVKNIVAACKDINKLNGTGYKFINLASGFLAHYDINGFKSFYYEYSLREDIVRNASMNQWSNFREGDANYDYYKSKAAVYNSILTKL